MVRSKKQLAVLLSKLKGFEKPNVRLEQYETDSESAAEILWFATLAGDIEEKRVSDLGCGTGILGLGALILGAQSVRFIDIDEKALEIAKKNFSQLKSEGYDLGEASFIHGDIAAEQEKVDTVLQNPPFGTRQEGIDTLFIKKAQALGTTTYTFHKSSTKAYISELITSLGGTTTHCFDLSLPLKNTYEHHTKRLQRIKVSVWRILWPS